MKKPKHTKAPFHVTVLDDFDAVRYAIQEDKSESVLDEEALANKRLLEAAPFLLQELRFATTLLANKYHAPDDELVTLYQALLKAEG